MDGLRIIWVVLRGSRGVRDGLYPKGFGRVWNGLKGFEKILGVFSRAWEKLGGSWRVLEDPRGPGRSERVQVSYK